MNLKLTIPKKGMPKKGKSTGANDVLPFKDKRGKITLLPANMTLAQLTKMGVKVRLARPEEPMREGELRDACKLVDGKLYPE